MLSWFYTNCTRSSPLLNRVLCAPVRNNIRIHDYSFIQLSSLSLPPSHELWLKKNTPMRMCI